jgi:hypothetical protein
MRSTLRASRIPHTFTESAVIDAPPLKTTLYLLNKPSTRRFGPWVAHKSLAD